MSETSFMVQLCKDLERALVHGRTAQVEHFEATCCRGNIRGYIPHVYELMKVSAEWGLPNATRYLLKALQRKKPDVLHSKIFHQWCYFVSQCPNPDMLEFLAREILRTDEAIAKAASDAASRACDVRKRKGVRGFQTYHHNAIHLLQYLIDEKAFLDRLQWVPVEYQELMLNALPARQKLNALPEANGEGKRRGRL